MNRYPEYHLKRVLQPEELRSICYNAPETATRQEIWEMIRIRINKNLIFVDATSDWIAGADNSSIKMRYQTQYRIETNQVTVVTHKKYSISNKGGKS